MDEEALIRRWIETWERAGPELVHAPAPPELLERLNELRRKLA